MIVKMIRYGFMLHHSQVSEFLERLRDLGLVDITVSEQNLTKSQKTLYKKYELYRDTALAMQGVDTQQYKDSKNESSESFAHHKVEEVVEYFTHSKNKLDQLLQLNEKLTKEREEIELWGDFDPFYLQVLKDKGIEIKFYEVTTKQFNKQWAEQYPLEVINERKGVVYFTAFGSKSDTAKMEFPGAVQLKEPTMSISAIDELIEENLSKQVEHQSIIARSSVLYPSVEERSEQMLREFVFSRALSSGESVVEDKVKIYEGFSTEQDRGKIEQFAEQNELIFTSDTATIDHNPPIKLKNNFFSRLYEPIGKLYMLPRYNELDMTPFFAPFFMIFFGMCFSDAGYGLMILSVLLLLWGKIPHKFKDFARLAAYLSGAAVIFGLLTGNFFGVELAKVGFLSQFKSYMIQPENLFNVAIGMGVVQVLFGQILRVFNRAKRGGSFVYGLSALGWVLLMISGGGRLLRSFRGSLLRPYPRRLFWDCRQ